MDMGVTIENYFKYANETKIERFQVNFKYLGSLSIRILVITNSWVISIKIRVFYFLLIEGSYSNQTHFLHKSLSHQNVFAHLKYP